jgi:hypothetical protein
MACQPVVHINNTDLTKDKRHRHLREICSVKICDQDRVVQTSHLFQFQLIDLLYTKIG